MQILERSAIGLRAAELTFQHPDHAHRFVLLPMVHIAVPKFYEDINERLTTCDFVLFEGVKSLTTRFLTASYRLPARSKRLGLVLQSECIDLPALKAETIHADTSTETFETNWKKIPWRQRMLLKIFAPLYGAFLYLFGTWERLASSESVNDLTSRKDILNWDEGFDELDHAVRNNRDFRLCEMIKDHFEDSKDHPSTTAILYGGRHMPAVIRLLREELGYRPSGAIWRNAIPFI